MGVVINFFMQSLASSEFLFSTILIALAAKIYFIGYLLPRGARHSCIQRPWFLLLGVMITAMLNDLTWIIKLAHRIFFPHTDYTFVITVIRIDWAVRILQYQFFALFLESLTEKKFRTTLVHTIQFVASSAFVLFFLYFAFFDDTLIDLATQQRVETLGVLSRLDLLGMRYAMFYMCIALVAPSLIRAVHIIRSTDVPLLLRKQLRIFITNLLFPLLSIEFFQMSYFSFFSFRAYFYHTLGISTLLLLVVAYYCMQKVLALRFLNLPAPTQAFATPSFFDEFKNTLESLSHVTNTHELGHLTQTFFKEAFGFPIRKILFAVRPSEPAKNSDAVHVGIPTDLFKLVESYMSTHDAHICTYIANQKILVYDELVFSNFYEESAEKKSIIAFLKSINAELFIPIYTQQKMSAYIIIEQQDSSRLYSKTELDQMLIFAGYLGTTITLLRNKNIESCMVQEKELREELYSKQQEITHYKESLQSFLRNIKQNHIGVLFYKNRFFSYGNQAAKEFIRININTEDGHPLTRTLKRLVQQAETYKTAHTTITTDSAGNKIMLYAAPHIELNTTIITVAHPDLTTIITQKIALLREQSSWDYLLYLETTRAGKRIEQYMPGTGETLTNFKIELLRAALHNKALLIDAPDDDLMPLVELIQHISTRETLHTIVLNCQEQRFEVATKLFGINPLLSSKSVPEPLLKKIHPNGTILIANVHFLARETQDYLAEYVRTGYYRTFKGDQKAPSAARIICSSTVNIGLGIQQETFSPALFHAIHKNTLTVPSLAMLPEQEFNSLVDGFAQQAIKTETFKTLLELTEKDKNKLALTRPASLHEVKTRVHTFLTHKSKKNRCIPTTSLEPACDSTDPALIEAARLGKHALRDKKTMNLLWHKFKNQNKIATFLGVNRSSVNRRCKEYKLM